MDALNPDPAPAGGLRAPALPPDAPQAMPRQDLWRKPPTVRVPGDILVHLTRFLVIGAAIALTVLAGIEMFEALNVGGMTTLEWLVLALFVALFAWIALAFSSSIAGFVAMLAGRPALIDPRLPLPELRRRTAILMPTYNENPARVAAALQAIDEGLQAAGRGDAFAIFILSDTTDPDVWIAEEQAFLALRARTGGHGRIFYRRRPRNIERKAGNIADWVTRFGGACDHMLVLDADSVMTADTIVRLAAAMEADDRVGLVQTLPILVGGRTLFARMQQFAGRIYGPLIARGIATWHGREGNYWGHNAIIRTRAFAEAAGLPHLRGRKPFGGHILSHDFVEAALIRRAGWSVRMVPALSGSYEEGPPSLTELAVRDRRWCQGNLQHAAVLPARGLHWVSRLHLLMGIGSYITAPMWFGFLCIGILIALQARFIRPEYFPAGATLFPQWPAQDPVRAMWVFAGTMALLVAPKLLAWIAMMADGPTRRASGGGVRMFAGVLVETVLAGLLAPVTMLSQSAAVVSILSGRDGGWQPQQRDDGSYPLRQVAWRYAPHTATGLVLAGIAWAVSPHLLLWMSPVVVGLALAIPLVALAGSRRLGMALAGPGILRTPEESMPPAELRRATELRRDLAGGDAADGVAELAADPALLDAHRGMLPPPRRPGIDPIDVPLAVALARIEEGTDLDRVVGAMSRAEKLAVLGDARALDRLLALRADAKVAVSPPASPASSGDDRLRASPVS
ncbi:membrane glycosyltransferase [Stella humosa]|uniref:Glucans biosynthesis glucosyltransferase H n=1 Tax=Stella humosa TaxID=94 RepID=A0A3N1MF69_9PROT|nr:glucans biosynthesis glucosyltransferase MdoH [Stella humosa]ROP99835.1 membrane glycosyltransferase [Stella humosa]BBK30937.1 glucans biosynthesis glucosyltransferase H [Stella humosa]